MKDIFYSSTFKKDLKKVKRYNNFKPDKFKNFVEKLAAGEKLPESACDHALSAASPKKYQGMRDFHLAPDICVIYNMDASSISLIRIGQHNHLGLTENL